MFADLATTRQEWRRSGYLEDRTVADALESAVADHPETPFTWISRTRPETSTLGAIYEQGLDFASGLRRLGALPGDVVACQLPNWFEGAVAMAAAFAGGFTFLPIVHIYGVAELRHILTNSRARI